MCILLSSQPAICDPYPHTQVGCHSMSRSADRCALMTRAVCIPPRKWSARGSSPGTLHLDESHEEGCQGLRKNLDCHLGISSTKTELAHGHLCRNDDVHTHRFRDSFTWFSITFHHNVFLLLASLSKPIFKNHTAWSKVSAPLFQLHFFAKRYKSSTYPCSP